MSGPADSDPHPANKGSGSSRQQRPAAQTGLPPIEVDASVTSPAPGSPAFTEFVRFYRASTPRLVAFLLWQGAPLPDAADCAQQALIEAFDRWSSIREPHAWCRLVASRLYARQFGKVEDCSLDDPDSPPGGAPLLPPSLDPDDHIAGIEDHHRVLQLLNRLPMRQRQVMAWTYDGATPAEIAETLQIRPEAVRSNLYKARTTLRRYLDEDGSDLS